MTDLIEGPDWVGGIYQLEITDPVVGGVPDLAAGQGIANVQAQQLAKRTTWLKDRIAGLGGELPFVPGGNLNNISITQAYAVASGDIGSPASASDGVAYHFESAPAFQITYMSNGQSYFRDRTEAGVWGAWDRVVREQDLFNAGLATDTSEYVVSDANNALTGGFWTGNAVINAPDPNWVIGLSAFRAGGQTGMQICTNDSNKGLYQRTRFNGVWQPFSFMGNPSVSVAVPNTVGCYMFARINQAASHAQAVPGSSLVPAAADGVGFGDAPSGTWRCLGRASANGTTLFVRIA